MAKNAELFINVCNFMKYFLNEVLPENEPTELILDSIKELLLALIKYTKLIKYDISPVVINENNYYSFNAESRHPKTFHRSEQSANKNIKKENLPIKDVLDNHKLEINIKEDHFSENKAPPNDNCPEKSVLKSYTNEQNSETEKLNYDFGLSYEEEEKYSFDEGDSSSPESNSDLTKDEATKEDNPSLQYNNESIKHVIPNDHEVLKEKYTANNLKSGPSSSEEQISGKFESISLSEQTSERSQTKIIPLEFMELNRCLMDKLLSNAYYCWECGFSVAHIDYLRVHAERHNEKPGNSKAVINIVEICSVCSFVAAIPQHISEELVKYHMACLHKVPSGIGNYKSHLALIQLSLQKKFQEEDILPNFTGICLICDAVFETPLEWNSHIGEFRHLQTGTETVIGCSHCCIVILGYTQEIYAHNYLSISDHTNFCRAIKFKLTGLQ